MDHGQVSLRVMGRVGVTHAAIIDQMIVQELKSQETTTILHLGVVRDPHGHSMQPLRGSPGIRRSDAK